MEKKLILNPPTMPNFITYNSAPVNDPLTASALRSGGFGIPQLQFSTSPAILQSKC